MSIDGPSLIAAPPSSSAPGEDSLERVLDALLESAAPPVSEPAAPEPRSRRSD